MSRFHYLPASVLVMTCALAAILVCSCGEDCVCPSDGNGTAQTPRGWFPQDSPTTNALYEVHVIDVNTIIAVGSGGTIIRSSNGGETWTLITSGTTEYLRGLSFGDADTGWAVGENGVILKTSDGGQTWTPQISGTTENFRDAHFLDVNTGWAVGNPWGDEPGEGIILKTTNGGTIWEPRLSGLEANAVFFVDADTGIVALGTGDVHRTTDGGENWTLRVVGSPWWLGRIRRIHCQDHQQWPGLDPSGQWNRPGASRLLLHRCESGMDRGRAGDDRCDHQWG